MPCIAWPGPFAWFYSCVGPFRAFFLVNSSAHFLYFLRMKSIYFFDVFFFSPAIGNLIRSDRGRPLWSCVKYIGHLQSNVGMKSVLYIECVFSLLWKDLPFEAPALENGNFALGSGRGKRVTSHGALLLFISSDQVLSSLPSCLCVFFIEFFSFVSEYWTRTFSLSKVLQVVFGYSIPFLDTRRPIFAGHSASVASTGSVIDTIKSSASVVYMLHQTVDSLSVRTDRGWLWQCAGSNHPLTDGRANGCLQRNVMHR